MTNIRYEWFSTDQKNFQLLEVQTSDAAEKKVENIQKTLIQWWHIHYDASVTIWLMAYFYKENTSFLTPSTNMAVLVVEKKVHTVNGHAALSSSIHRCLCCMFQTLLFFWAKHVTSNANTVYYGSVPWPLLKWRKSLRIVMVFLQSQHS